MYYMLPGISFYLCNYIFKVVVVWVDIFITLLHMIRLFIGPSTTTTVKFECTSLHYIYFCQIKKIDKIMLFILLTAYVTFLVTCESLLLQHFGIDEYDILSLSADGPFFCWPSLFCIS